MSVKDTIASVFAKLPFKTLAEKIPESTLAKAPVLKKAIPFANQIVCGLAVLVVVVAVACSGKGGGGGGGRPNPATDFSYDLTEDGTGILIKGYTGGPGKIVIPAKIEDMPVLEIGDGAFDGDTTTGSLDSNGYVIQGTKENEKAGITAIVIPDTVKKIGSKAFANTAITSIVIPDSVTELASNGDDRTFEDCKLLTEVHLSDNIEILPVFLFLGCDALKKVNLPKNLKIIGGYGGVGVFGDLGELSELIIPETLTSVEFAAYKWNNDSKEGKWVKEGEKWPNHHDPQPVINAFSGCTKLPLKTRQHLKAMGYNGDI